MDDIDKSELEREREEAQKIDTCKQYEGVYLDDRFELADVMTIGLFHFEAGAKQFDVWSAHMIEDLGPEICPHLKEIWLVTRKEFLRVSVELEKRMKARSEAECPQAPESPKSGPGSEIGIRPRQGLLFDGPIQPGSKSRPDRIETELPDRPTESRPQAETSLLPIHNAPAMNAVDWRDMTTIGLYHLQNGADSFPEWAAIIVDDLGEIVRPYLDELWEKTQMKYCNTAATESLTSSNESKLQVKPVYQLEERTAMKAICNEKALNWFVGGLYILFLPIGFLLSGFERVHDTVLFLIPLGLFVWQMCIVRRRYLEKQSDTELKFHRCITGGDWWRFFWILLIGHLTIASENKFGFFLLSGIIIGLIVLIILTVYDEYYEHANFTPLMMGCLVFGFILLSWEKNTYVIHYGVPIIGHFFEKPEYDAKYYVEIESKDSGRKYKVIADVHVEGESITEDVGEGYYGQPLSHTFEYRHVLIKRLYFQNGSSVGIEDQSWAMSLDERSTFVKDSRGRKWHVTLLNEPVQ